MVNFGPEDVRQVITNIGKQVENPTQTLIGVKLPFITNLKPAVISGHESLAMIMVGKNGDAIEVKDFTPGAQLL